MVGLLGLVWAFGALCIGVWFLIMFYKLKKNTDTMTSLLMILKKQNEDIISELKKNNSI